jgi:hypothetical protein
MFFGWSFGGFIDLLRDGQGALLRVEGFPKGGAGFYDGGVVQGLPISV